MKNILIAGAWPYANGSLHIGHIAGLLPGDVLARYYRSKGDRVVYVSGSDCHGTPITIRAKQEGLTAETVCEQYHDEFLTVFAALGFSYDLYTKTTTIEHKSFVRDFHSRLYEGDYIYEKTVKQAYCPSCQHVLTDRLIKGVCPSCQSPCRGDQCDHCGEIIEIDMIINPCCSDCSSELELGDATQLYLAISKLESELQAFLDKHSNWRRNAIQFTQRYIDEGLRDRAITRDLDWGIDVPRAGYEQKRIYIWAENVLGYLSASKQVAEVQGLSFDALWGDDARHYYVHGKDNIPFHTIILPALLLAEGKGLRLPDDIISSEHMTLEGRKISTSQNWAVWAKDLINCYNPDALRYFFIANGPEKRDTDFSWREFIERNNNELLGAYGNFVNRSLVFIKKYMGGIIPEARLDDKLSLSIHALFDSVGSQIEAGHLKDALDAIFEFVRYANKYYDREAPWKTRLDDPAACAHTLYNCVQIIGNLAILLSPFLPFSSAIVTDYLHLDHSWAPQTVVHGIELPDISILFERLKIEE